MSFFESSNVGHLTTLPGVQPHRMAQRRQFRVLYRGFLLRFLDIEALAAGGAMHNLLTNVAALLGAFSFVLALLKVPQYYFASNRYTGAQLAVAAWEDQKFVLSTAIMVVGLFTVLLWDALFPDRRDCLVLGPLPVRMRTLFAAKLAATAAALGLAAAAVNVFTGLSYPFLMAAAPGGIVELARLRLTGW